MAAYSIGSWYGISRLIRFTRRPSNKHREQLKNALLVDAISKVMPDKIDAHDKGHYDGTRLPPITVLNKFCYLTDPNKYLLQVDTDTTNRYIAVNKFLDTHLRTEQQVQDFYLKFLSEVGKKR